jgi:DNA-binding NarL/FixJ family response regulator
VRIAVADDSVLFRDGLSMLLEAAGHEVVGRFADGDSVLGCALTTGVDVAVLDIRMPPGEEGGLVTARRLREQVPWTGLLILSHYAESHFLMRMLDIGTERIGYRLKDKVSGMQPLCETLERIAGGEIVIEPEVAARLVTRGAQGDGRLETLSEREREVLRLMAEGRSNASIASEMFVSVKAVEKHSAAIFPKLRIPEDSSAYHRRVLAVLAHLRGQVGV